MEPLNEGKPFLKGRRLDARMDELASLIAEEHTMHRESAEAALEHARNAGEWLVEAKWRKGHRSNWGKWKRALAEERDIATRTMSQYMRVARYWRDPRIEAARARGETLNITRFINLVKRSPKALPKTNAQHERDSNTTEIRREFAEYLRRLDAYEVGILYATMDEVMAVAHADLRERVCGHYEGPYYKHREEYHRGQEAARHTPKVEPKKKSRSDFEKEGERAAAADMKTPNGEKWNELPVRGNSVPPTKPRRRKKPKGRA